WGGGCFGCGTVWRTDPLRLRGDGAWAGPDRLWESCFLGVDLTGSTFYVGDEPSEGEYRVQKSVRKANFWLLCRSNRRTRSSWKGSHLTRPGNVSMCSRSRFVATQRRSTP